MSSEEKSCVIKAPDLDRSTESFVPFGTRFKLRVAEVNYTVGALLWLGFYCDRSPNMMNLFTKIVQQLCILDLLKWIQSSQRWTNHEEMVWLVPWFHVIRCPFIIFFGQSSSYSSSDHRVCWKCTNAENLSYNMEVTTLPKFGTVHSV